MANVVTLDVWEAKIGSWCRSQSGINVLHYRCLSHTGTGASDFALAQAIDLAIAPAYKAMMSSTAAYYGVRVQRVAPAPKTLPVVTSASTGNGTAPSSVMALQTSGVITWQTTLVGRANRGRSYIPFPAQTFMDTTSGTPTTAYTTAMNVLAAAFLGLPAVGTAPNQSVMQVTIFHKKSLTDTVVSTYRSNLKFGTQRRRSNYGQQNPFPPF